MPLRRRIVPILGGFLILQALTWSGALAAVTLTQLSEDPYTDPASNHKTQVEPDATAFGSTIVAAFQSGRFQSGGANNIGWATSTNAGASWTNGFLPNISAVAGGPYDRVTDPSVAYDAAHNVWLISSLPVDELAIGGGLGGVAVVVSRSTDGGLTWGDPITIATGTDVDKNWTVCDNTATSPFYGHCYTEWDDHGDNDRIKMSTSLDGGLTWSAEVNTTGAGRGTGGVPVVQPNGTVVVPIRAPFMTDILAFRSTDGGTTWSSPIQIATISHHTIGPSDMPFRTINFPSADVDRDGVVYVAWEDCRFRRKCASNDIVMSKSTDGVSWSSPTRIPIDRVSSKVDHFIPGLGIDPTTTGAGAHLGLTYYYYPRADCAIDRCQLNVGFVSSPNGGATWTAPTELAGPMSVRWLPQTSQGLMVGDYIATPFVAGQAHPVFAVAKAAATGFDEAIYTPAAGLVVGAATAP